MLPNWLHRLCNTFMFILSVFIVTGCATPTPISAQDENATPIPRRIFADLRVYSATTGTINQYYDSATDKILSKNIWVFRPDGTYSAIVNIDGKTLNLSGVYSGDGSESGFIFSIETNNDSHFDESLYTDDSFSFIEWRRESGTLKYFLVK